MYNYNAVFFTCKLFYSNVFTCRKILRLYQHVLIPPLCHAPFCVSFRCTRYPLASLYDVQSLPSFLPSLHLVELDNSQED